MEPNAISTPIQKIELYEQAKKAYYEGKPIMSDVEFDELEIELGLENRSYVGAKSENYTVRHPFIMGSLSKVQVKEDSEGNIDWQKYRDDVLKYIGPGGCVITPKMDGCSFETVFEKGPEDVVFKSSTRGDGEYGKDITWWFMGAVNSEHWDWDDVRKIMDALGPGKKLVVRGEVMIDNQLFAEKYSEDFTNPRTFVAGVIGQDYTDPKNNSEEKRKDLSWICYDYRIWDPRKKTYDELGFEAGGYVHYNLSYKLGQTVEFIMKYPREITVDDFKEIYEEMDEFRKEESKFFLDGIVFKPLIPFRKQNITRERPEDCVAVKFLPEIVETEILNVEWKVGKTGEIFPTAICKEVILGGKSVTRASLHNYGYMFENKVGVGSKVLISLMGDIVPGVYSVQTQSDKFDFGMYNPGATYPIAEVHTSVESGKKKLMAILTEEQKREKSFISSAETLTMNGIGPSTAKDLYDLLDQKYDNIIYAMSWENIIVLERKVGNTKSGQNIIKSLRDKAQKISLEEIIMSMNLRMCGEKASKQAARLVCGLEPDFTGLPYESYSWCINPDNIHFCKLRELCGMLPRHDLTFYDNRISGYHGFDEEETTTDKIPVIMTGEPSNTSYKTKKEWLKAHPQYKETTSWKEVKILFTGDLNSSSSKMDKARKKGIEIRLYDE